MPAEIIFGDIGSLDPNELRSALCSQGIKRVDIAARYMNGESEKKIGKAKFAESFQIDTKILTTASGDGTLTAKSIGKSLTSSLTALCVDQVHILYCHNHDMKTPIIEQARAMNEHYRKGRFLYLGVSNFSIAMLREWLEIADREGFVKPSVYQGQYNLLCRSYEETLFPLLRGHDMRFGAFSPLAGGFLMGNYTANGIQGGSRFASIQSPYKGWYDQPSMHDAIRKLQAISKKTNLGMDELSLRWLKHHSILGENDWMILGASKVSQIMSSCEKARGGPLDAVIARELTELWQGIKAAGVLYAGLFYKKKHGDHVYGEGSIGIGTWAIGLPRTSKLPTTRTFDGVRGYCWRGGWKRIRLRLRRGAHTAFEVLRDQLGKTAFSSLDAFRRLRAPLGPRGHNYNDLRSVTEGRDAVAWYWRLVALGSSIVILGGFLILPITFYDRTDDLRASSTAVGIFAVALLTAGFVLTGLLCFAVRVAIFQVESIFMPSLVACVIGFLTVFYDFLVYKRYHWNTPAFLVAITGAVSSVIYGFLVLYTYRKIHLSKKLNNGSTPLDGMRGDSESTLWQERAYYENYIQNMFPTSARQAPSPGVYHHNTFTEEDMQRQQMLMLLQQREQPPTHGRAPSTFHIDWEGREDEVTTPVHGYYAPLQSSQSDTAYSGPSPGITRQFTRDLPQWDGLWRTPVAAPIQPPGLSRQRTDREDRRREIEMS